MHNLPTRRSIRSCSGSRDGIALVTVLAFIVLLTILIISFISFTRLNRLATGSYSRSIQAQEVALGGMQDIVSDLRQEIIAGSTNYTVVNALNQTNTIYVPLANLTAVPTRVGYLNTDYTYDPNSNPTLLSPTLVRVSRGSPDTSNPGFFYPNFTTNSYFDQTLVKSLINRASAANTSFASVDGRKISAARWNKIEMLSATSTIPTPFSANTPDWVYVTRAGSRACTTAEVLNGSLSYTANVATNYYNGIPPQAGTNPPASPIVGRYAYVMYDEGALLDANVVGSPSSLVNLSTVVTSGTAPPVAPTSAANTTTGMTLNYAVKSYIASADLMQIPGFASSGAAGETVINNFINWRNGSVAGTPNTSAYGVNYLNALLTYASTGFLSYATGDSPILGRQDLINYFSGIDSSINTTSATYSKVLPYLGTFSRAESAPTCKPSTPTGSTIDYASQSETAGKANRDLANVRFTSTGNPGTITHYADDATSAPYTVNDGDPLLKNRFSLAKINWLSQSWASKPDPGTTSSAYASSIYPAAIQACFGLSWGSPGGNSTTTANGGNPCWNYVGSLDNTGVSHFNGTIETLDQVATEGREPNFFELLKAAILSGSLGLGPGDAAFKNGTDNSGPSSNAPFDIQNLDPSKPTDGQGAGGFFSKQFGASGATVPSVVPDIQIMKIGANIIDQYDSDSYPTAIYFPYSGVGSIDPVTGANAIFGPVTMVYGDENLPLLNRIFETVASPNPSGTNYADTHSLEGWLQPELWNPHQMPSSTLSNVPQNFEIRAYGGAFTYATNGHPPLADPANPPNGWSGTPWTSVSPVMSYYPGVNNSESGPGVNRGTITFSTTPGIFSLYDTPRLLVLADGSGIPGLTNVTSPLVGSVSSEGNIALSNFPNYNVPESNGSAIAPNSFTNHFVAFTTGLISDQDNGGSEKPFYVASNAANCGIAFSAVAPASISAASFAMGWLDSNSNFHPYSFITGSFIEAELTLYPGTGVEPAGAVQTNGTSENKVGWGLADPRTERLSQLSHQFISGGPLGNSTIFPDTAGNWRVSTSGGVPSKGNFVSPVYAAADGFAYFPEDWEVNSSTPLGSTRLSSNDPRTSGTYYVDPDGIVRPGDGIFSITSNGDGLMLFTSAGSNSALGDSRTGTGTDAVPASTINNSGNSRHGRRPVILNRPFRSVGELGYVFRDMPFKTLDFFSTASADSALLDVFSLTDESRASNKQISSIIAGQIDLSNAPLSTIQALLVAGSKKDLDPAYNLATFDSTRISKALGQQLNPANANPNPLMNRADLVTRFGANPATGTGLIRNAFFLNAASDTANKAYLEGPVRSLASVTNTRTWNLLIDVIAQSGQMSSTAKSLNDFVVQGERRYWLHIAIDRYTGKIVSQQLEPVYE